MKSNSHHDVNLVRMVNIALAMVAIILALFAGLTSALIIGPARVAALFIVSTGTPEAGEKVVITSWQAPAVAQISKEENAKLIEYGRDLIIYTSKYLGPNGSVKSISNGMNCQNCHLDAGTKAFGNNYSAVASTYPKLRARSGMDESIEKRVNDCFERSLNGKSLPDDNQEMMAIVAYIKWVGKDVEKGTAPNGAGLMELKLLDRSASMENGKVVYDQQCIVCHGKDGGGIALADSSGYQFPPLWGDHSYNAGAGLYRLSRFAGYVKANMPLGATFDQPILSDEEAWDVAAYVNLLPRPGMDVSHDWPDISKKPIDHPFGPYADGFDEAQHKLGPFKPIKEKQKALSSTR